MNLDKSQQRALDLMQSGQSVFLTGVAGSGKSHVVSSFIGGAFTQPDVVASTGIAALNLQQQLLDRSGRVQTVRTIYSWAGIGLGPQGRQTAEDYMDYLERSGNPKVIKNARQRIRRASTLIIDEVSMVPGRILSLLDQWCRRVREDKRPVGGIQVVAVGDFLQLPPVSKTGQYDWAFKSQAWSEANLQPVLLDQVHRQDEPVFVKMLNDFRAGRMNTEAATVLASRVSRFPSREIPRLMTHNAQVDNWNNSMLADLDAAEVSYSAEMGGNPLQQDMLVKNLVTPKELILKPGCRIITTANKSQGGSLVWVNGQTGKVLDCLPDSVTVKFDNGNIESVERHKFQFDPQDPLSATMTQFPLRLAYAMTIHKSQGLTLPRAYIDIRAAREPGQAYVALSRVRTLAGVHLKDWIKGFVYSPEAITFYNNLKNYESPKITSTQF